MAQLMVAKPQPREYNETIALASWAFTLGPYGKNPHSIQRVFLNAAKAGYQGVSLGGFQNHPNAAAMRADRDGVLKIKDLAARRGLKIVEYASPLWDYNILKANKKYRKEFQREAAFAQEMGIPIMRIDTNRCANYAPGTKRNEFRPIIARTINEEAQKAFDKYGIRTGIEFEPGFDGNKPSEIVWYLDQIKGDYVGVLLDTCHMQIMTLVGDRQVNDLGQYLSQAEKELLDDGPLGLIDMVSGRVMHVHTIDSDGTCHPKYDDKGEVIAKIDTSTHEPLSSGNGVIDFAKFLNRLREENKSGSIGHDFCEYGGAERFTAKDRKILHAMFQGDFSQTASEKGKRA